MLALFLVIMLFGAWQATNLRFDHKRHRFFPSENKDLAFTNRFFKEIEQDDIYILVGLEFNESVLNQGPRNTVKEISEELEKISLVEKSMSISNFKYLKKGGPKVYAAPLLSPSIEQRQSDSIRILETPYVYKSLISDDYKSVSILLKTAIINSQEKAEEIHADLDKVLDRYDNLEYHLGGFPIMQSVTVNELQWEMQFYVSLSGILLLIILFIIYRSIWGLLVPFLSLAGGLAVFFAYIHLSGQKLDLMSSLFPILMLIFLMADVVHLQTHYMDELSLGKSPIKAMEVTIKEIGLALFLTSFTTAVGFGTLATSRIEAIRHFGLNAAVGVLIAFALVIVFASSALLFFNNGKLAKLKKRNNGWERIMNMVYQFNKTKYRFIMIGTIVLLMLAFVGVRQISTNAFIKGDIPDKAKLKEDFEFFESNFAGVRTFEMAIMPAVNGKIEDVAVLQEVAKLETYLVDTHGIGNLTSPTITYRIVHNAFTRAKSKYAMPTDEKTIRRYRSFLKLDTSSSLLALANTEGTLGRISGRQRDLGSDFHEGQISRINNWIDNNIDSNMVAFKVTGTTVMYDRNHEYLRLSLFRSLGLAFIIVGLLFALLFKDYRMVVVSIIPNLIPLLIAAGFMGFLDIKLQALTSIFFAISFGIAVDDTIHFLTRFKLERRKGLTVDKAIKSSIQISGKAIIITSIILIVSFISLTFSDFKGTYYIGVLVSVTLASALLSDLFVLPQLLYFINRTPRKKKKDAT